MEKRFSNLYEWCLDNNQQLLDEWDYDKNDAISPNGIAPFSNKKVWWKCEKGHEYQAMVNARTGRGNGCPYCSGHRVLAGFNDLETLRSNLMKEWNYNKNTDILPSQVTIGSEKKVWWICEKGHEWKSAIANRTKEKGTGCPKCRQQYHTSFPEKAVAFYLKKVFPDLIENYYGKEMQGKELDIFIPSQKVAIEYDGGYAHKSTKRDIEKDKICNLLGIKVIHIREFDCPKITDSFGVYFYMTKEKWASLDNAICFVFNFLNIKPDFSIDNQADKSNIYEFMDVQEQENSLLKRNPELAKEWHPTKNGFLQPEHVTSNSNVKVWWQCEKGHEWQTQSNSRMRGNGCPVCANKVIVSGFNDLETTHPHLIEEWNFERNSEVTPNDVTAGSEIVVWWKGKCGHEYKANIYQRTSGHNCPICAGIQLLTGFNDLQTKFPEIAKEWNCEKNGDLTPDKIFSSARKTVWWRCEKGHEYQAAIYHRTGNKPTACPICANRKLLKGYNDFETLYPQIAKEWHPTLNGKLKPNEIICRAGKTVWWKCSKCGHEYQKKVVQKVLYPKCPKCQE